jgi:hypothetical protein
VKFELETLKKTSLQALNLFDIGQIISGSLHENLSTIYTVGRVASYIVNRDISSKTIERKDIFAFP